MTDIATLRTLYDFTHDGSSLTHGDHQRLATLGLIKKRPHCWALTCLGASETPKDRP